MLRSADEEHKLRFARRWINVHADVALQLGKPLVLAEFGKKAGKGSDRADFYKKVTKPNIKSDVRSRRRCKEGAGASEDSSTGAFATTDRASRGSIASGRD
jgi:hypothetical protein